VDSKYVAEIIKRGDSMIKIIAGILIWFMGFVSIFACGMIIFGAINSLL